MTLRLATLAVALAAGLAHAQPVGTAFTYQGRLTDAGNPADGAFDLQLRLFDASSSGTQVGPTLTRDDVAVSSGLFTVSLDFGAVFAGNKRWLEIGVRPGASTGAYTTLAGRQELAPAPNAAFSATTSWTGIAGKPAGFADDVDDDSGGDITGVNAGDGLTGGGPSGDVSLAVSYGGGGASNQVARADHTHLGQGWTGAISLGPAFRVTNTGLGGFVDGMWGQSDAATQARGLVGYATSPSGGNHGVWGQADSTEGRGVFGYVPATSGLTYGVMGQADSTGGRGVYGLASATAGQGAGVVGQTNATFGHGVEGIAAATVGTTSGVYGTIASPMGSAVVGVATTTDTSANVTGVAGFARTFGVNGEGSSVGVGVRGFSPAEGVRGVTNGTTGSSYAVRGFSANAGAYAGWFEGRVNVTGTLTKGGGAFKIDHPLDPEHKYLYHSFVESPDMKNIYDGVVTTDADGYATVELPDWFEALNRDFRYQLTVLDDADQAGFVQVKVVQRIGGGRFRLRTSAPRTDVSWQVTGIRHDAFAEKNRIPVEEDKPAEDRGRFAHPVEHGQPREKGVGWQGLDDPVLRDATEPRSP